jgi:hypothetical protein
MPIKKLNGVLDHTPMKIPSAPAVPRKTLEEKAADSRGTFNPANDPYPGSVPEAMGVPANLVGSVMRFGSFVGDNPLPIEMRVQDLLLALRQPYDATSAVERTYRERIRSPLTAIRAFCVLCAGGPKLATACDKIECPLWAFHRGRNALRNRKN